MGPRCFRAVDDWAEVRVCVLFENGLLLTAGPGDRGPVARRAMGGLTGRWATLEIREARWGPERGGAEALLQRRPRDFGSPPPALRVLVTLFLRTQRSTVAPVAVCSSRSLLASAHWPSCLVVTSCPSWMVAGKAVRAPDLSHP